MSDWLIAQQQEKLVLQIPQQTVNNPAAIGHGNGQQHFVRLPLETQQRFHYSL